MFITELNDRIVINFYLMWTLRMLLWPTLISLLQFKNQIGLLINDHQKYKPEISIEISNTHQ
jgi:hypothetical protein